MSSHYAAQAGLELSHPSASCLLSTGTKSMSCHNLCLMSFPLDHLIAAGSYEHISVISSCFQYCRQNTANCASEHHLIYRERDCSFRFPGLSYFPWDTVQCHSPALVPHGPPHHLWGTIYVFLTQSLTVCETRSFPILPQHRQCYTVATKVQWWPCSGLWMSMECCFLHLEHCLLLAMPPKASFPCLRLFLSSIKCQFCKMALFILFCLSTLVFLLQCIFKKTLYPCYLP